MRLHIPWLRRIGGGAEPPDFDSALDQLLATAGLCVLTLRACAQGDQQVLDDADALERAILRVQRLREMR